MSNVARQTIDSIQSFSPSGIAIPAAVFGAVMVMRPITKPLYRLRNYLYLYRIYRDPANYPYLIAGYGAKELAGNSRILQTHALSLHILAQIIDCVDELSQIDAARRSIKNVFLGNYVGSKTTWTIRSPFGCISVSHSIKAVYYGKDIVARVQIIAIAIFRIGSHTFLLTINICSLIHTFLQTSDENGHHVSEIFINSRFIAKKLATRKEYVMHMLKQNEKAIENVLTAANSRLKAQDIADTVRKYFKTIEKINKASDNVSRFTKAWLKACVSKWTNEILTDMGLHDLAPEVLGKEYFMGHCTASYFHATHRFLTEKETIICSP